MATILLIEDDEILLDVLRYNLEQAGYAVETASDGVSGLELSRRIRPDLVILDVMLPRLDGFSVCRTITRESLVPIVLLTALQDESHRIAGLELGAIDYVVKPFSMGELLARTRSILRWNERRHQTPHADQLQAWNIRLDRAGRRVWLDEHEIDLSNKEFDLLACLMAHMGIALSRDLLLEYVWGADFLGSNRTIDVHIRWLREKLEPDPANPVLIRTVRGIGYCFENPAAEQQQPTSSEQAAS
ncbi:MAG TPA: response regulator transcription factor [Roseiflexaceae bacterium]|nr:response regulator transcription factor [Roseiflexaceae bacterium]